MHTFLLALVFTLGVVWAIGYVWHSIYCQRAAQRRAEGNQH